MLLRYIHPALEFEINGLKHKGSFLFLEDPQPHELVELLEICKLESTDALTKKYYDLLIRSQRGGLDWLISVDGNFLLLRDRFKDIGLDAFSDYGPVIHLPQGYEGGIGNLLTWIRELSREYPELADRIFKNAALSKGRLPSRVDLGKVRTFGFETFPGAIQNAMKNPTNATDDELVLAIIMNLHSQENDHQLILNCKDEARLRYTKESSYPGEFFDLSKTTLQEIELRRARGLDTMRKFNNKFPADRCIENKVVRSEEWEWAIRKFIKSLNDDVLTELLLVFYSSSIDNFSERKKLLYLFAQERLGNRN